MRSHPLGRLARRWWQSDRVRIAPAEGWLLRLRPPCFLSIGAQTAQVFNRRLIDDRSGVIYDCLADGEHAELRVLFTGLRQPPALRWACAGVCRELDENDVSVYAAESTN